MADFAQFNSFVADAVEWRNTGAQPFLRRLIRSACSGVGHDVAAAYATVAERTGDLLDAIDRELLALPAAERDDVLRFAQRARRVRDITPERESAVYEIVAEIFELAVARGRGTDRAAACAVEEFELTTAAKPEEPDFVPPWKRHFSASALNAYAECTRKWFYRYACAAVEDRGSSASAYGTALHLALEDFHGDYPRPARGDEPAMRRRIRECVTWAFERNRTGFETAVEFRLQVRRAQRTAQRYVDWLLTQEREAPFEVLGREVAASVELGGQTFVGFIDRLDRDERSRGISVIDYKTGSIALSAAEYADKIRRFRDFQLPFYFWARTAAGDRVTKLTLIPLKDALLDVRPIVLDVTPYPAAAARRDSPRGTVSPDELERSRARMIELSGRLAAGEARHFDPTNDAAACAYCSYALACARKPLPEGRRFGS